MESDHHSEGGKHAKIDDVLGCLGVPGKFQTLVFCLLCINYMPLVSNHLVLAFSAAKIHYVCGIIIQNQNNTKIFGDKECEYVDHSQNKTYECTVWHFYPMSRETTITMEWNLVCNREYLADLAITIYFCGVMLGGLFFGYLCDLIGRRPVMITTMYLSAGCGSAVYFAPTYLWFVAIKFIQGFFIQGLHISTYCLVAELFISKLHPLAGAIVECFWGVSVLCLAGTAYFVRDWRNIHLAINLPSFMSAFYMWFIPESIRWMFSKRKTTLLDETVVKIARFNKLSVPWKCLDEVKSRSTTVQHYTLADLIKTPVLRKRSLILFYVWLCIAIAYYGLTFKITAVEGNKYLHSFVSACVEMIAYILALAAIQLYGCRSPTIAFSFVAALTCIVAGVLSESKYGDAYGQVATGLAILGKFAIAGLYSVTFVYTSELYPTVIRNIGIGTCAFWARLGSVLAPQIDSLGNKHSASLPVAIFGTITCIIGFLMFMLPATHGYTLPETIDDIEKESVSNASNK